MSRFVRKGLQGLEPYAPGEQPRDRALIKLNTNENPYGPSPAVSAALAALDGDALRRYPDPTATQVREAAAELFDCSADHVIVGNGSDELLRLCLTTFVEPGDAVVLPDVTYSLYETLIAIHGARVQRVPLDDDFGYPRALADARGAVMFLCHPNAPTGLPARPELVESVVSTFPGVVVIDEAYADFADHDFTQLARRRDDVLVLRTLSKSYSLAGMRIGLGLGAPELIAALGVVKDSYNLSVADQVAAVAALRDQAYLRTTVDAVRRSRARLVAGLRDLGLEALDSAANFVFVRLSGREQARAVWTALRDDGVLVRYFSRPRVDDGLRITVGTDEQIDRTLACIGRHVAG